ncbi:MAG: signal peptidase [Pseudomonadota bacterium]
MNELSETAPVSIAPAKPKVDWWGEIKGIFWLILAVLGFHSFIAKPFYIPSESMMPGLLIGDRLVVTKYPFGWSFVSPTFHLLPFMKGRLFGSLPERGDIVIASPPGVKEDYIKRVIGLPGDRIEVRGGTVILNGVPVRRDPVVQRLIAIDANTQCKDEEYPGLKVSGKDGKLYCQMPVVRETLPNGRSYDTIDLGDMSEGDNFPATSIPEGHVFLMGDNRDRSADSRFPVDRQGLGGPVPWENIGGRAEFITFSLDGTSEWWNPISWATAMRGGRSGVSLHAPKAE